MRIPSYREIAKACDVHCSTVSRALGGSPLAASATKDRILDVARKMGWRPNPMASAFVQHRRSARPVAYRATLAYVVSSPDVDKIGRLPEYHRAHLMGVKERGASLGYQVETFFLKKNNISGKRLSRILKSRGIPGVIFHEHPGMHAFVDGFDWDPFAVATWGIGSYSSRMHVAACHHAHGMRTILNEVERMNYHDVALLLSSHQVELSDWSYFSEFNQMGATHTNLRLQSLRLEEHAFTATNRKRIQRWIEKYRPEVVIGEQAVWRTLKAMKLDIPGDIAFVSPFWSSTWPDIAGLDQRTEIIGANTVDLVSGQLIRNERGIPENPKFVLSEGRWREGASLPLRR